MRSKKNNFQLQKKVLKIPAQGLHSSRLFSAEFLTRNSQKMYIEILQSIAGIFNHLETRFPHPAPLTWFPNRNLHSIRSITAPKLNLFENFPPWLARRLLSTSLFETTDVYELLIRYTRNSRVPRSLADSHTLRSLLENFLLAQLFSLVGKLRA